MVGSSNLFGGVMLNYIKENIWPLLGATAFGALGFFAAHRLFFSGKSAKAVDTVSGAKADGAKVANAKV